MKIARSELQNGMVLLLWGGTLLYFFFSGRVLAYLHPAFHWATLVAGAAMVLLGFFVMFFRETGHGCCGGHESPTSGWRCFILVVPLLAATIVSPSQFGATAVANRGVVGSISQLPSAAREGDYQMPRNSRGHIEASTVDLLYASAEPSMRADFDGQEVEVIGQFLPARTGNPHGDRFQLVRMFVVCCAADSRPVAVAVQGAGEFEDMEWLRVTGRVSFPTEAGKPKALVVADSIEKIDAPEEPFSY